MANLPIAQCANVELRWTKDSQQCENTFNVNLGATVTTVNLLALAGVVNSWIADSYKPLLAQQIFFTELQLTSLEAAAAPQIVVSTALQGENDALTLPNDNSFCVSLRSGLTGRASRGRWYMPPPMNIDREGENSVSLVYANAARTALFTLIGDISTAGYTMGVISRVLNGVQRVPPVFTPYTNASYFDRLIDSMASRKPGHGA